MAVMSAVKVVLKSGKVVILREMKISDTEVAAQEVSAKAKGDKHLLEILMQKALVKLLILQIDGKAVSATEREDMDSLFKIGEYGQVLQVIGKMSGADDMGNEVPQLEVINSGAP